MIDPVGLPREIQELIPLPDAEIKTRLHKDGRLVEIFRNLGRNQVSHVEKPLVDRFLSIIEEAEMDPLVKLSLVGLFENVGAIATDLSDDKLDVLIQRYTSEQLVSNWSYFSQNNKDKVLLILVKRGLFEKFLHLLKNAEVNVNIYTFKGEPLLQYVYQKLTSNRYVNKGNFENRLLIIKALVAKGADIEARSSGNQTLLEKIILSEDRQILKEVVDLGANPNAVNKDGVPFLLSMYRNMTKGVETSTRQNIITLIEFYHAFLNLDSVDLMATDSGGQDLYQLASEKNDNWTIEYLLDSPRVSADDKNGYQLSYACELGDWELALVFIAQEELNPNLKNKDGLTPLWMAYQAKNLQVIKALLERENIDPNLVNRNKEVLLISAYYDLSSQDILGKEIFRAILDCKRTDLNQAEKERDNILHSAFTFEDMNLVHELLKNERINPNTKDSNRLPLLVRAYKKLQREVVFAVLNHPQADVNTRFPKPRLATDFNNGAPLSVIAFLKNDTQLLTRVMEDPRFDINAEDDEGLALIHYALRDKNRDLIVKLLRNKKLDPISRTRQDFVLFEYVLEYEYKHAFKPQEYDRYDAHLVVNILLDHPRLSKADKNGYRLWMALLGFNWDEVNEILKKEPEINVRFKGFLKKATGSGAIDVTRELLRRGATRTDDLLITVCRRGNREMARYIFDTGPALNFDNYENVLLILNVLFPSWNWDRIIKHPILDEDDLLEALAPDSSSLLKPGAEKVNPLEYFLVFPNPDLLAEYLFPLDPAEGREYLAEIQKSFPEKARFLELKTRFKPPQRPERTLPPIEEMPLESAINLFKTYFGRLNFIDSKGEDYISSDRILDQGSRCSEAQMRSYVEEYCFYLKDPGNSKFEVEKKDSGSYQKLREKFRYVMHYFRKEFEVLEKDDKLTPQEKSQRKKSLDHFLMLMAASGNHCMLAKNDVLEEIIDKAYGVAFLPTISNQVAYMLQRSRLWTIEQLFTNYEIDPPELLTHDMYAFMIKHRDELGVLIDDLVEDDPFVQPDLIDPDFILEFKDLHSSAHEAAFLREELQTKGSEISPELFKHWLSENVPPEWTPLNEMLSDLEKIPEEFGYSYLYRNFAIDPTPEEILLLLNPENVEVYKKSFDEITERVNEKYRIHQKHIEDEINKRRASLVDLEDPERTELQHTINRLRMQIPLLPAKKRDEIQEKKRALLYDRKMLLPAVEYVRVLKERDDVTVIREKLKNAPVEKQWQILRDHHIPFIDPLEALMESEKSGEELETIRNDLENKTEEEKWSILADHKIFHAHPKTPYQALVKYRSTQYANQAYVDGEIRIDRINALLISAEQMDYA